MQIQLSTSLPLERCPHCAIVQPQLARVTERENNRRGIHRRWGVYECLACGGLVIAATHARDPMHVIVECYPGAPDELSDSIPARPREYLRQARDLIGQPTGSVTLSASAVDAMLKEKGLKEGRLYERIHDAVAQHLIGEDMAQWAHQVSLDPNDSRCGRAGLDAHHRTCAAMPKVRAHPRRHIVRAARPSDPGNRGV